MWNLGPEIVISGSRSHLNGQSIVDAWFMMLELVLARQPKKVWLETAISFIADDLLQQFIEAQGNATAKGYPYFKESLVAFMKAKQDPAMDKTSKFEPRQQKQGIFSPLFSNLFSLSTYLFSSFFLFPKIRRELQGVRQVRAETCASKPQRQW